MDLIHVLFPNLDSGKPLITLREKIILKDTDFASHGAARHKEAAHGRIVPSMWFSKVQGPLVHLFYFPPAPILT